MKTYSISEALIQSTYALLGEMKSKESRFVLNAWDKELAAQLAASLGQSKVEVEPRDTATAG